MAFEPINPPQFPTPIAPYSAGAKAGNTVYVSGVLALGEGGVVLHVGDAAAQTRHILDVIRITLEAAGKSEDAKEAFQRLVDEHPASAFASEARARLG